MKLCNLMYFFDNPFHILPCSTQTSRLYTKLHVLTYLLGNLMALAAHWWSIHSMIRQNALGRMWLQVTPAPVPILRALHPQRANLTSLRASKCLIIWTVFLSYSAVLKLGGKNAELKAFVVSTNTINVFLCSWKRRGPRIPFSLALAWWDTGL